MIQMDEKIKSSFSEYKINYNPASSYLTGGTIQTSIPYAANQANNLSTKVDEMDLSLDSDVETIENSASEWLSSASDFLEQLRKLNNEEIERLQVETDSLEAKYQEYLSNLHLNLEREELIKKLENQLNVLQMNASFSYGLNQEDEISRLTEQISALRKEELEEKIQYIKEHSNEFESFMGMGFEEYNQKIIYNEYTILELKAKDYQLRQQAKELPYEQIKTTEEYISYVSSYTGGSEKSNTYLANRNLENYLSEEQLIMFSYLYDTRDFSEANAYLEAIEDKINQAKGMSEAQVFLSRIIDEEGNVDVGELEYIFTTMGQGLLNGIETFGEGFENLFDITSDGMVTDNQYAQQFILQGLSELQEKGQISKFIDDTYQISTSIGNMLPGSIISILTGGTVGHVLMGMSAAGNAKNEALISNSDNIALAYLYGAFNGASEAVVGKIMGNIPGLNEGSKFAVKEILSEGAEEFVQTYVDAGLKAVVYHEIPDLGELTEEGLKSFLYGCITSGIMTGSQTAISFTINGVKYSYNNMSELINAYSDGNIVENLESTKNYKLSDRKWSNKYYKELAQSYDDLSFLSQNTGKHLEEIFFDNENVIGIHRCGMMDAERIMDDGLLLTGHLSSGMSQNQSNFKLERNISFYDKTEMGYLNFIRELKKAGAYKTLDGTGDVIIVSIPKSEIVYDSLGGVTFKNSSSAIDFSGVTPKLSSEYLLGYLNSSPDVLSDIKFRTQIDGDSKEQSENITWGDIYNDPDITQPKVLVSSLLNIIKNPIEFKKSNTFENGIRKMDYYNYLVQLVDAVVKNDYDLDLSEQELGNLSELWHEALQVLPISCISYQEYLPDDIKLKLMLENGKIYNIEDVSILSKDFHEKFNSENFNSFPGTVLSDRFEVYLDLLIKYFENSSNTDLTDEIFDFYYELLDIRKNCINLILEKKGDVSEANFTKFLSNIGISFNPNDGSMNISGFDSQMVLDYVNYYTKNSNYDINYTINPSELSLAQLMFWVNGGYIDGLPTVIDNIPTSRLLYALYEGYATIVDNGYGSAIASLYKIMQERGYEQILNDGALEVIKKVKKDRVQSIIDNYEQVPKTPDVQQHLDWANNVMISKLMSAFPNYMTSQRLGSLKNSIVYLINEDFELVEDSGIYMGYNNGKKSVINTKYKDIKAITTHESLHQLSSKSKYYDSSTNTDIIKRGIKIISYHYSSDTKSVKFSGLNEALTEYFTEVSLGEDYPKVSYCGYEKAVIKLKEILKLNIEGLDISLLEKAYFENNPSLIAEVIDNIVGVGFFENTFAVAFDKAIKGNVEDLDVVVRILTEISIIKKLRN